MACYGVTLSYCSKKAIDLHHGAAKGAITINETHTCVQNLSFVGFLTFETSLAYLVLFLHVSFTD